jgi:hypothetical protein
MKSILHIILLSFFLFYSASLYAQSSDPAFKTGYISGGLQVLQPMAELYSVLDPSPVLVSAMRFSYFKDMLSQIQISYARLDGPDSPAAVHCLSGLVGLDRQWFHGLVETGTGLSLFFLRAAEVRRSGLLLADNESDFGFYLKGALRLYTKEAWALSWSTQWHSVLTLPKRSHLLQSGLVVEYRLW